MPDDNNTPPAVNSAPPRQFTYRDSSTDDDEGAEKND